MNAGNKKCQQQRMKEQPQKAEQRLEKSHRQM
jgi:hypothetical protein